jgi:plasmid maintenance system antidote protein VapI
MGTKTEAYPDIAIPPREYLTEEIQARGMSQKELAKHMGRPLNAIDEIIDGKALINKRAKSTQLAEQPSHQKP